MKLRYALLGGLFSSLSILAPVSAQDNTPDGHILNLTDVDIMILIEDVGTITGNSFVVHPDVRANVNVSSPTPLSTRGVFEVFLATLRVHGYAAVPEARNVYRIVPEELASLEANGRGAPDGVFFTEVFRLDYFNAVEAAKLVQPLLGPQGKVNASNTSNAVIIVERRSNIERVRRILSELDLDQTTTRTVKLTSMSVTEMQSILTDAFGGGDGGARGPTPFSAVPAPASNAIIMRGTPEAVDNAAALVRQLDVPSEQKRETRVLRLSHAQAATVLPILNEISDAVQDGQTVRADGAAGGAGGARIALHEPSNALIISAEPDVVAELAHVASELDVRRKQVLVEAIIVEVSDTAALELGVQFLVAGTDGDLPLASSTFSSAAPNLLALTGALASDDVGGAFGDTSLLQEAATASLLGLTGGTVGFGAERNGTLFSVVLNALEEDVQSNILSKPSILALNNETAEVSVGQEIPISSGQVLGDANVNPFQTTEREQIGVVLNVTPRIADDNTIQLTISQEVSSIASAIGTVTTDFILNQTTLNTSVIVDDGELVVLGGLIQAEDMVDREQVPILGDIPIAGRLFQFEQESRSTSNLMVFIRPTIIDSKEKAQAATTRNYNYIRAQQIIANEGGPALLDDFVEQTLDGKLPDIPYEQSDEDTP